MIMTLPALAAVAAALLPGTSPQTPQAPHDPGVPLPRAGTPAATAAYWTSQRMRAAAGVNSGPSYASRRQVPVDGVEWTAGGETVRHIGRLFMRTATGDLASCTAATVSAPTGDMIATAAHCVHDRRSGGWMDKLAFVPAYRDGQAPYGVHAVVSGSIADAWRDREDNRADYAFLRAAPRPGVNTTLHAQVGAREAVFERVAGEKRAFGYPAVGPFDGERLQYCHGPARVVYESLLYGGEELACRMTDGASGGPWYDTAHRQTGVSSGRPADPRYAGVTWAAVFDARAKALYDNEAAKALPTGG
ncbi:trypsin-like serine peptidase [Streptomyces polyrhachis]|uniref:Trypsin-like serine peptidase n=1 Tax=Streptomyces polyrhachis TaxID=1282885 RepID=A0ABW2GLZ3_9ACTN